MTINELIQYTADAIRVGANDREFRLWREVQLEKCGNDPFRTQCNWFAVYIGERTFMYAVKKQQNMNRGAR